MAPSPGWRQPPAARKKYACIREFQEYLDPTRGRVRSVSTDHAEYGAAAAAMRLESDAIAFAVAGHHAGLHDASQLASLLEGSRYHASTKFAELIECAEGDCAAFAGITGTLGLTTDGEAERRQYEFATRGRGSVLRTAEIWSVTRPAESVIVTETGLMSA